MISYKDPGFASYSVSGLTVAGFGAASASSISILVTGAVSISAFGGSINFTVSLLSNSTGLLVAARASSPLTIPDTGASIDTLIYTTMSTTTTATVTEGGSPVTVQLTKGTIFFGGSVAMPSFLQTILNLNTSSSLPMYATINGSNWSINAQIPQNYSIAGGGGFGFTFANMTLSIAKNGLQGISMSAAENGYMYVCGSMSGACSASSTNLQNTIAAQLAITYTTPSTVTFSISVSGATPTDNVLTNLFGTGINVQALAFSIGINFATTPLPTPILGLAAHATLPASLMQQLGIAGSDPNAIPVQIVLNLSLQTPCLDVEIGTQGSTQSIINIGGIITANYADFYVSPLGCTVGIFTIPAGFGFAFAGTFMGVAIQFQATLTLAPTFSLTADFSISGFTIGPFSTNGVYLHVAYSGTSFAIGFRGNIQIASGLSVSIAGSFDSSGNFSFTGSGNLTIGSNFTMQLSVAVQKNGSTITAAGSGVIDIPSVGLTVNVSGQFTSYSNMSLSGNAAFSPGGFNVGTLAFSFSEVNGNIAFSASAGVDFGPFSGSITGALNISTSGVGFYLQAQVAFSINGNNIAGAGLTIANCSDSTCVSFSSTVYAKLAFSFLGASMTVSVSSDWSFSWADLANSLAQLGQAFLDGAAQILGELGADIAQAANALADAFNVGAAEVTQAFNNIGATVSGWASDIATGTAQVAAEVLQGLNDTVNQIGSALASAYQQTAQEAAQILSDIGYAADQVASALDSAYQQTAQQVAQILNAIGDTANEIAGALDSAYQQTAQEVTRILGDIGETATQIAGALQSAFNATAQEVANCFNAVGEAISSAADALSSVYNQTADAVNSLMQSAGWAETALVSAFQSMGGAFQSLGNSIQDAWNAAAKALEDAANAVADWFNSW